VLPENSGGSDFLERLHSSESTNDWPVFPVLWCFFCKIYNLKVIKPGGALFEFLSPHFCRSAAVTIDNNFVGPARGFLNILLTRQSQRKP